MTGFAMTQQPIKELGSIWSISLVGLVLLLPKYGLGQISDIGVVVVEVALDERIVEVGDEDDEDLGLLLLTLVVELDAIVTGYSEEEEEEEKEDETDEKEDDANDNDDDNDDDDNFDVMLLFLLEFFISFLSHGKV